MLIKKTVERIPGGMMMVPLLLGALINTCFSLTGKTLGLHRTHPRRSVDRGSGVAGIAAATTAGNAAAVPAAIASIDPTYARIAPSATILVATSVVVTAILAPIATALYAKRVYRAAVNVPEFCRDELV